MRLFYPKFALDAIRKNKRSYIPFLLTVVIVTAMYTILRNLAFSETLRGAMTFGISTISSILEFGSQIVAIFSVIFLFYTSSFLMKQRKQEFGLYSVLGMERRHIAVILFFETLFLAVIGVGVGILVGSLLNWLSFLILLNMIGDDPTLPFSIDWELTLHTIALYLGIFLLIFLNNLRQVRFSSTISLLKSGSEGEREPRSKWIFAVLGVLLLGAGYTMALLIKNPVGAFSMFFVAVVLVILGTYCLFTAGSIVLLKALRKNKHYYYKTKHFISVSGMLYRMKQNAVSLGNICILSTMVLVTVSSTMSLFAGCDNMVRARYPREVNLTFQSSALTPKTNELAISLMTQIIEEAGETPENTVQTSYLSFGAMREGNQFITDLDDATLMDELTKVAAICVVPQSDYVRSTGEDVALETGQVLAYCQEGYDYDTVSVLGQEYTIVQKLDQFPNTELYTNAQAVETLILVVPDSEIEVLYQLQVETYGKNASQIESYWGADVSPECSEDLAWAFIEQIDQCLVEHNPGETYDYWAKNCVGRSEQYPDFIQLFAGLFFVGVFLGLLFLVATILIIYYKQVSEGLQDHQRFIIMQKVGLTKQEIRSSIRSQVLTVFFLPLVTAFIHTAFAFPMVNRCLSALNMTNVNGFLLCLVLCCGVFAVFYLLVYLMTSRVYYRIVNQ